MCEAREPFFHQEYIDREFKPPMLNNPEMTVEQALQSIENQIKGYEAVNVSESTDQKSAEERRFGPTGETVIWVRGNWLDL